MPGVDIDSIKAQLDSEITAINSQAQLEEFRIKYLGRKGVIAELTGSIPGLAKEQRALFGQQVNSLKQKIISDIEAKQKIISDKGVRSAIEEAVHDLSPHVSAPGVQVDISLPGIAQELGHMHPITRIIDEICNIFIRMGFSVVEGPEIETEYNNFTGLNIPLDHPSRDAFDTFYLKPDTQHLLLRSHTSPVQVRAMKKQKPPLAIVVPGRVYRPDATDASHLFMFHQIEGFMVDKDIKFSDLKILYLYPP